MVKDFLSHLGNVDNFEFSNLYATFKYDDINYDSDVYFVGESSNILKRAEKLDIFKRNYILVDLDIRENHKNSTGEIISDQYLLSIVDFLRETLDGDSILKDWRYIVFSGNGFHIYYTGDWKYNEKIYEKGVEWVYDYVDNIFGNNKVIRCDHSCNTVNRLSRLPGSTNTKRSKKHGLDNARCEIIETRAIDSEIFNHIGEYAKKQIEKEAIEYVLKKTESDRRLMKSSASTYDAINELDIVEVVSSVTGLVPMSDGKNFKSPKDGGRVGMFVYNNIIIHTGTHYISDKHKGYNVFSFVKEFYSLDNQSIFKWFSERYQSIADLEKRLRQEYKQQTQESTKPQVEDWRDFCISYGELLDRTVDYRHSINPKSLCSYGVPGIDKYLKGILPDELVVIAAGTGVGKSSIAYEIGIANAAMGKKVMLFALEGSLEEIALRHLQRKIAEETYIRTVDYRFNGGMYVDEESIAIDSISDNIKNNLIIYNKTAKTTMKFVKEMIVNAKDDVDLFIIDHLHYIQLESENENREVGEIMRELKLITDILKKPVVLISHLRKPNQGLSVRPTEYDLYGSSNIAKEATTILLIYRSEDYVLEQEKNKIETGFYVPKSRIGLGRLQFYGMYDLQKKKYDNNFTFDEEGSGCQYSEIK